jgi:hypothetical protein
MTDRLQQLRTQGYVILPLLDAAEVAHYRQAIAPILAAEAARNDASARQALSANLFAPPERMQALHPLACDPRILALVEELIGSQVVLDNATFYMNTEGRTYQQGWHRDIQQVPIDQVDERWFAPDVFFNCLQLNLPLYDDATLQIVPGSHCRPLTTAERALFAGDHQTSPAAEMPEGITVMLKAGEVALYNNNMLHRGFSADAALRTTFHASYHCSAHRPTWHFYCRHGFRTLTAEQAAALLPPLQELWARNQAAGAAYPDPAASWPCPG